MKEHVGTSLVSTLEILQPNTVSFFWRIMTVDEKKGRIHSVTEGRERHRTHKEAESAGEAALDGLHFA
ncbi:hypothetical protein CEG14_14790 [Bordetella genomosp. 1]|uniref:Uncharacterized protein n=1 Tax=Bordetella genomosp. 1 TaxID=1395607 RepID=A0A261SFX0_9BORD|nr:hypothetical protein [Bordetella genomosp. 1]OZI36276.1 hypothetical protein CEG14_14790 [Bordetella genomosp. 1]